MSRPLRGCRVTLAARPKSPYMLKQRSASECASAGGRERERENDEARGTQGEISLGLTTHRRACTYAHTPRPLSRRADTRDTRFVLFPSSHSRRQIFLEFVSSDHLRPGPAKGPDPPEASSSTSRYTAAPLRPAPLRSAARRSVLLLQLCRKAVFGGEREQSLPIDRRGIVPYAVHDRGSIDRKRRRVGLPAEIRGTGTNKAKRFE